MTTTGGFELHPEAAQDIIAIREHIARDNPVAAIVTAATSTTDDRDSPRHGPVRFWMMSSGLRAGFRNSLTTCV